MFGVADIYSNSSRQSPPSSVLASSSTSHNTLIPHASPFQDSLHREQDSSFLPFFLPSLSNFQILVKACPLQPTALERASERARERDRESCFLAKMRFESPLMSPGPRTPRPGALKHIRTKSYPMKNSSRMKPRRLAPTSIHSNGFLELTQLQMASRPALHQGRRSWHDPRSSTPARNFRHRCYLRSHLHPERYLGTFDNRKKPTLPCFVREGLTNRVTRFPPYP